jgi:hypothetical protein
MLHRQVESNPRNRFLVSLNVYKYGLWTVATLALKARRYNHLARSHPDRARVCNFFFFKEIDSARLGIDSYAPYKVYKFGLCIPVKKRKSSALASVSPKHCRLPIEKGIKCSSFSTLPSALNKQFLTLIINK